MIANITINKVISSSPALQGTLLDLTNDSVAENNLVQNETAHNREGESIVGEFSIEDSEAWAVGTRNGIPVQEGDVTYHNNSLWHSQVSEAASQMSASCMLIGGQHAEDAEAWAVGSRGGIAVDPGDPTYNNHSEYWANYSENFARESQDYSLLSEQYSISSGSSMRIAGEHEVACGSIVRMAGERVEDAEAWAVGTRSGVPVDSQDPTYNNSSEYWARHAQQSVMGGIIPRGTCLFENLPSVSSAGVGDMWNIEDDFTTTSDFREGAGVGVNAGANVYKTIDNKWDVMAVGGGGSGGAVITFAAWLELTPEQRYSGDWYIVDAPINSSILPIAGFDTTPTQNSIAPVTSHGIYTAIQEAKEQSKELPLTTPTMTGTGSTVTTTITDARITEDMDVVNTIVSNSSALLSEGDWTIPDGGGSIIISGVINGSTTITVKLMKAR